MNEIRTQSTDKKTPFSRWNIVRKNSVEFSENPTFRIQGKDIGIREYQNKNAIDCNIYEVIEKYRGDLKMSVEELNQFHNEVNQELTRIKSLPDALMAIKEGEQAWRNLPMETRQEFGNSIQNFMKNGNKYFENKIKEYNDLQKEIKAKQEQEAKITQQQLDAHNSLMESRFKWIDAQMKGNN